MRVHTVTRLVFNPQHHHALTVFEVDFEAVCAAKAATIQKTETLVNALGGAVRLGVNRRDADGAYCRHPSTLTMCGPVGTQWRPGPSQAVTAQACTQIATT